MCTQALYNSFSERKKKQEKMKMQTITTEQSNLSVFYYSFLFLAERMQKTNNCIRTIGFGKYSQINYEITIKPIHKEIDKKK